MKVIIKYILTAVVLTAVSCKNAAVKEEERPRPANDSTVTLNAAQLKNAGIKTGSVTMQNLRATIRVNGAVDVPPQSMVSISFPLGGYLKSTSLLPGSSVRKGEVIAIMEDQNYVQLQQDYLTAKAKMEFLQTDMQRQKELSEADATSKKNYQLVLSDYKTQQVLLKSLEEKLRIIEINPARLNVQNISRDVPVYSPINGYVTKVNVNIGKYVNPSDVLFELVDPDDIHASITVFEKDINYFKKGMKGKVSLVDDPAKTYDVDVILVTKNINDNRSGLVHCHFDNPIHELLPGMFLNGVFELDNKKVQAVTEESVVRYHGKDYLFAAKDSNVFVMMPVQTGNRENGYVELIQDGRDWTNTPIVTGGAYALLSSLKNRMEE
ncbi:efflux RND transporter periplasmic adaptor subunit [Danxiaibacter flavus]|uniref:Efflux RND transporter periplasmic adaptor subunit n=1 Tax=Danxiaibacter flavus TaxID=3049108 RepID=A0ABV3ZHR8_9BACT|nr:efflux RND transporter periplasmic adaptor subunit [Chitinophagaceae bacterium DXS]